MCPLCKKRVTEYSTRDNLGIEVVTKVKEKKWDEEEAGELVPCELCSLLLSNANFDHRRSARNN